MGSIKHYQNYPQGLKFILIRSLNGNKSSWEIPQLYLINLEVATKKKLDPDKLYLKIGKLEMENGFLKKNFQKLGKL